MFSSPRLRLSSLNLKQILKHTDTYTNKQQQQTLATKMNSARLIFFVLVLWSDQLAFIAPQGLEGKQASSNAILSLKLTDHFDLFVFAYSPTNSLAEKPLQCRRSDHHAAQQAVLAGHIRLHGQLYLSALRSEFCHRHTEQAVVSPQFQSMSLGRSVLQQVLSMYSLEHHGKRGVLEKVSLSTKKAYIDADDVELITSYTTALVLL